MTHRMNHQLEIVGGTATLYIGGTLGYESADALIDLCTAIPIRVRTLRLDLHGLGQLSADATGTIRLLLRHWRESRRGDFRLSTSHMLATLREVTETRIRLHVTSGGPRVSESLTATYL